MTCARYGLFLAAIVVAGYVRPAAAQNTENEFWPELDIYSQLNPGLRIVFADAAHVHSSTEGRFAYYVDFALRPVFRRDLRWRNDVFRQRYLDFRGGYEYLTSVTQGSFSHENRGIIEITSRYRFPGSLVLEDRNRVELRFIEGQAFSVRYRNRLQVSRDFGIGNFSFTPFANAEAFYDSRYGGWSTFRYELGIDLPIGPHLVVEPYGVRQRKTRGTPVNVNGLGLTIKLFL